MVKSPPFASRHELGWVLFLFVLAATYLQPIGREVDLFYQLRQGLDFLDSGHLVRTDQYSHTALGRLAEDFQWLPNAFLALFYRATGGYLWMPLLRVGEVFLWLFFAGKLARTSLGSRLILFPVLLVAGWWQIELRPDLLCASLFCCELLILSSERLRSLRKNLALLGLLIAWANIHAGTIVIGAVIGAIGIISDNSQNKKRWTWAAGCLLTPLLTPLGTRIFSFLWENLSRTNPILGSVPDMYGLNREMFNPSLSGLTIPLWLFFSITVAILVYRNPSILLKSSGAYRSRSFFWITWFVLTTLSIFKPRARHYEVAFLIPVLAPALEAGLEQLRNKASKRIVPITAVLSLILFAQHRVAFGERLGLGLDSLYVPSRAVSFIHSLGEKPKRELWNYHPFGSFILQELKEYPVSSDTRGFNYLDFFDRMQASLVKHGNLNAFIDELNINFVIEKSPESGFDSKGIYTDSHQGLFPQEHWALIYFDELSVVYLRRIPEHQSLIAKYEWRLLFRNAPPIGYLDREPIGSERNQAFEKELDRCLILLTQTNPEYCSFGKAVFLGVQGDSQAAQSYLRRIPKLFAQWQEAVLDLTRIQRSFK